jgi:citrate lyase subunit beta/citryl-CoA lyase
VLSLYGQAIRQQVNDILHFYGIRNALVDLEDSGALPYVIAARLEAAVRQIINSTKEYLLPALPQNSYTTPKDHLRRSRLYIPGNNPKLVINSGLYKSDGIILDLEDAVVPEKKDEARILVRNALRNNDMMGAEKMVRINQLPAGLADIEHITRQPLNMILIPKCESPEEVKTVDEKISSVLGKKNNCIWLMPIVETAIGVLRAFDIAMAAPTVAALAIGLEDYTANIGALLSPEGWESFYARSVIVNAARAAGIQPIDSVFADIGNNEALRRIAMTSRSMGFEGMGCIHPGQIPIIHESFNPSTDEIEKAKTIVLAFEKAQKEGLSVVAVGTRMVDPPVVKRAQAILDMALTPGFNRGTREASDRMKVD